MIRVKRFALLFPAKPQRVQTRDELPSQSLSRAKKVIFLLASWKNQGMLDFCFLFHLTIILTDFIVCQASPDVPILVVVARMSRFVQLNPMKNLTRRRERCVMTILKPGKFVAPFEYLALIPPLYSSYRESQHAGGGHNKHADVPPPSAVNTNSTRVKSSVDAAQASVSLSKNTVYLEDLYDLKL